jgi:hypothetical protein
MRNEGRIEKLESEHGTLQTLVTQFALLEQQLDNISNSVRALNEKVERLESKPGKRWDSIIDKLAWALIAAALGFILAQLGITG